MGFVLSLIYIAFSLLSPSVLPMEIVSLHVNVILGIAVILALLPTVMGSKIGRLPDTYLVLGLLIATAVSVAATGWLGAVPTKMLEVIPIFIVFYFIVISCKSVFQLTVLVYVLLAVALFIFAQGAIADRTGDHMSHYLMAEGTAGNMVYRYKGLGVLSDPNDLAQFFVTLIPMLWIRWKRGSHLFNFLFTVAPALVLVGGMYFTHSRGGMIALAALTLFGFKDKLGVILSSLLTAGLVVAMLALNVSGGRAINEDDGGRVAAWSTGLEVFRAHPVFGVGIDNFSEFNDTGHTAHNSYVLCLAEIGILGYFCWMGMIVSNWTGLSQIARKKRSKDEDREGREAVLIPPHLRTGALAGTGKVPLPIGQMQAAVAGGPGMPPFMVQPATAGWGGSAPIRIGEAVATMNPDNDGRLKHAAKVFQVAFVGLLTSAFFLSRTFSMVFYVTLGMCAAVRMMYLRRHTDTELNLLGLLKRIGFVIVGSVMFLYLFVRIRGIHS